MSSEKTKIKILVDEVAVEGQIIHRSAADIIIKITNPFENLTTGRHIPNFGRPYSSFEGEYGDERAKDLLKDLYDIALYIDTNMARIRENLDHAKNSIRNIPDKFEREEFYAKRKELRQLLRKKELDNVAYQKELTIWRKKNEEYELKVYRIMNAFFDDNFPMTIPYRMDAEVLDILEDKKSLKKDSSENNGTSDFSR